MSKKINASLVLIGILTVLTVISVVGGNAVSYNEEGINPPKIGVTGFDGSRQPHVLISGWNMSGFDDITFILVAFTGLLLFLAIAASIVIVIILILPAGKKFYKNLRF